MALTNLGGLIMRNSKKMTVLVTLVLIMAVLSGCNLFTKRSCTVDGKITMDDGTALQNAEVYVIENSAEKKIAVTDKNGAFTSVLKAGKYEVVAKYCGVSSGKVNVTVPDAVKASIPTIKITALAKLNGTVTFNNDNVLIGVKVKFDQAEALTNENGQYTLIAPTGTKNLVLEDFGYSEAYDLAAGTSTKDINLVPDFIEDFNNLDNWTEEEDYEFNQWAITTKGFLSCTTDGKLVRTTEGVSGLKLKDRVINDAVVVAKMKIAADLPEKKTVGLRTHLRNKEDHWCYGYGVNVTTHSFELASWHGKDITKTVIFTPDPTQPLVAGESATIMIVVKGHTIKYYKNGVFAGETTDPEGSHLQGGLFLSLNKWVEVDQVMIYDI